MSLKKLNMTSPDNSPKLDGFSQICPECGVANPDDSEVCLVCDRDLTNIVVFLEDDSFDLEITETCIIEYRKNFWGTDRTGKVNQYPITEITNIEFGSPITRFKFDYNGERQVIPLKAENMAILKVKLPPLLED